jgi:hypothetical protein
LPTYDTEYERWNSRVQLLKKEIAELEERYKNIRAEDCCICYNNLQNPVLLPNCQHLFCGVCILEWYKTKTTCPLCRTDGQLSNLIYVSGGEGELPKENNKEETPQDNKEHPQEILSKPKTIINLIQNSISGKFIIFSDYDETFTQLKTLFLEQGINWVELTGTSSTKNKKLKSFQFMNQIINRIAGRQKMPGVTHLQRTFTRNFFLKILLTIHQNLRQVPNHHSRERT